MAKSGFIYPDLVPVVKKNNDSAGWSLCIGAGVSHPIFPTWKQLVERLIAHVQPKWHAPDTIKSLIDQFPPDALIQAGQERSGMVDQEFSDLLNEILYADVKRSLEPSEWPIFLKALAGHHDSSPEFVRSFNTMFERIYPNATALAVANVIADSIGTEHQPQSILSFNAERLLFALCNMRIYAKKLSDGQGDGSVGVFRQHIDLVTHSTSSRSTQRIQYFMCHGSLPLPTVRRKAAQESIDKLVFSESSYLQLANASFSWQASVFLDCAVTRPIIFIGTSMTDPNVRRWLGWSHENRARELRHLGTPEGPSTHHYWIRRLLDDPQERSWVESSVAHLGIRVVWIPSWDTVGETLRLMTGMSLPKRNRKNYSRSPASKRPRRKAKRTERHLEGD